MEDTHHANGKDLISGLGTSSQPEGRSALRFKEGDEANRNQWRFKAEGEAIALPAAPTSSLGQSSREASRLGIAAPGCTWATPPLSRATPVSVAHLCGTMRALLRVG